MSIRRNENSGGESRVSVHEWVRVSEREKERKKESVCVCLLYKLPINPFGGLLLLSFCFPWPPPPLPFINCWGWQIDFFIFMIIVECLAGSPISIDGLILQTPMMILWKCFAIVLFATIWWNKFLRQVMWSPANRIVINKGAWGKGTQMN